MKWRLIIDKTPLRASENMAKDGAILRHSTIPTLRIYSWNPCAISVGRFQSLEDEVNLEECRKNGVDVIRRVTGGGAVFHDKEITYSIVLAQENQYISKDLKKSYEEICSIVISVLKSSLDIDAQYSGINDISVDGKKVSGCAQTRKFNKILQHGTILLDVDVENMFSLLNVSDEKIKDKLISNVKERVTSLNKILGGSLTKEEISNLLVKGFSKTLGVEFEEGELTALEKEEMLRLQKEVFENDSWNFER